MPTRRDGRYVLWTWTRCGWMCGVDGRNKLRFLNHCSKPNAAFWGRDLYALRPIQPGEEITFHYGPAWKGVP